MITNDTEKDFKNISLALMKLYQEKMHEYLESKPKGSLTDSDVIIMIMNLTISISTNIYYSLKQILPTTTMDFDFIKVKLINSLSDEFDDIKKYNPKESNIPLTIEQVEEVQSKGYTFIKLPDGSDRKITKEEILVKKEDVDKIISSSKNKKEIITNNNTKIFVPDNRSYK